MIENNAPPREITLLLKRWADGDPDALDRLTPLVVDDLKRIARYYMRKENTRHTLQTTALLNEAYLRLVGKEQLRFRNRASFFSFAGELMRRILIEHARKRNAARRGGGRPTLALSQIPVEGMSTDLGWADLLSVHEALKGLEGASPRQALVVKLRFFLGLTQLEVADTLGVSRATLKRDWTAARLWLARELASGGDRLD